MDITPTGDCIVAGYERGQVIIWDTKTNVSVYIHTQITHIPDHYQKDYRNVHYTRR
jgi:hypothetical protein